MYRPQAILSYIPPCLKDHRQRHNLICKLIKNYLFLFIQFPCYDYKELVGRTSEVQHQVAADEYKEYENCSSKSKSGIRFCVLILLTVIFSVKNYYFQFINKIDMSDPETVRSNQWRIDENTLQVACVQTNCTDFPRDIRQFSLVHICYPAISAIYPPTTFLGPYASLMHGVIAIVATAWGLMALDHYFFPLKCDTIMFLVAPKLTRYPMIVSARQIYLDYESSRENYLRFIGAKRVRHRSSSYVTDIGSINGYRMSRVFRKNHSEQLDRRYLNNNLYIANEFGLSNMTHDIDKGYLQVNRLTTMRASSIKVTDDRYSCDNIIQDQLALSHLPKVRTMWWHAEAQDVFIKVLMKYVIACSVQNALFLLDFWRRYLNKLQDAEHYRQEMHVTGCRAWFLSETGVKDILSIEQVWTMQVDLLAFVDNIFLILIMLVSCCLGALFYLIKYELNYWRSDIDSNLKHLIEMTRSQSGASLDCSPNNTYETYHKHIDGMDDCIRPSLLPDNLDSCRIIEPIDAEPSAISRIPNSELTSQKYFELMAKLYVSFRLFMKHVERCSDTSPLLSFITLLLTYGITLMSVIHGRYLRQFSFEHMSITFMSIAYAATFLTFMSSFHAQVSHRHDNCNHSD